MSPTPMPWAEIRRALVERGLWSADGVSRKARARLCSTCKAPVIAGMDHERVAMAVYLDPTPLNRMGEAVALMTGRATYSFRWSGGHYEIDVRYAEHIAGSPAGSHKDIEILQSHKCNSPEIPAQLHGEPMAPRSTRPFGDDLDVPPF